MNISEDINDDGEAFNFFHSLANTCFDLSWEEFFTAEAGFALRCLLLQTGCFSSLFSF